MLYHVYEMSHAALTPLRALAPSNCGSFGKAWRSAVKLVEGFALGEAMSGGNVGPLAIADDDQ